ncbi:MAG TPA: sigma-70 family RNA polymerase sigma factor [Acidimicrobiia bacterium]|jgi:RNA polymerase sigma-70 factor (ECF subfamily)
MWSVSDDALLDGLTTGDPDAAAAFVERFQRRVYGLAIRILGDPRLAEDVAQETFVRAWRAGGTFDPRRGTVASWLLSITRNLAIDTIRVRRHVVVDPEELLQLSGESLDRLPDDMAVLSSESNRLHTAVRQLPSDQRRSLILAAYYGHTAREIAELDDIPLGTAKTRIRAAMRRLRAALVDPESAE